MPKKSVKKQKQYQAALRKLAKSGLINDASGRMIQRGGRNSMDRDYSPQLR